MARGLMPQRQAAPDPSASAPPNGRGGPAAPPAPAPPDAQGQQGRASEQDKETYRHFLANAVDLVYQDQTADLIVEQLNSEMPVEGLAQTIAMVVNHIGQEGLAQGVPVNGAMAIAVATSLAGDIGINMAEAAGRPPLNADQMQAVVLRSMELLRDMQEAPTEEGAPGPGAEAPMPGPGGPPPGPGPAGNGLMPGMAQSQRGGPRP